MISAPDSPLGENGTVVSNPHFGQVVFVSVRQVDRACGDRGFLISEARMSL
jgi:hypothetical protein